MSKEKSNRTSKSKDLMRLAYDPALLPYARESLGRMLDFSVRSLHLNADSIMKLFVSSNLAEGFGRGDAGLLLGMSGIELAYLVLSRSGLRYERTAPRQAAMPGNEYWAGYALASMQHASGLSFADLLTDHSASALIAMFGHRRSELLEKLPWNASQDERVRAINALGSDFTRDLCAEFTDSGLRSDSTARDPKSEGIHTVVKPGLSAPEISLSKDDHRQNEHSYLNPHYSSCNLKKLRVLNGLSQGQLAEVTGIPVRTIQQYEQGQKDLSHARAEYIFALARALHCEPEQLLR